MDIKKLAFLGIYNSDDSIMGVIMVTDSETKPVEFRVTSAIKPTNFQKILYGNVLKEHILVELVAVPLLNAISEQPDLILVHDPFFLGANAKLGTRVVRVFAKSEPNGNKAAKVELKSFNTKNEAMYLEAPEEFEDELPGIAEALGKISEYRDILEPFERLALACEQVHLKKTKE